MSMTAAQSNSHEHHALNLKRNRPKIQWSGYLYILPLYSFLLLFVFFGIGYNVYISLFDWNGIGEKTYIGFQNYLTMIQDKRFYSSLKHTLIFMVICIPGSMFLGLLFSILLHSSRIGTRISKSIFFIPYIMAIVVIGVTFRRIYEPNFGLLNDILRQIGLGEWTKAWIGDPNIALYSIAFVYIFAHVGFYMLLYYTSILNIDQEIFEASRMDGAGIMAQIRRIIIPMLSSTHIILLILGVIASLKVFEIVWVMTEGGPAGSTELVSTYLFRQALLEYKQGYSSSISVVLLVVAMIYTVFQLRTYRRIRR